MVNPTKVDYLSTRQDPADRKWYQSMPRALASEIVAEKLQDLIDDRARQGYEFIQILNTWGSLIPDGKSELHDASQHSDKPTGLLVMFRRI